MRRLLALLTAIALPAAAGAAERAFDLRLGALTWPPADPRTEQRRAAWDSPMGRLEYEMMQQRAGLAFSGLVGSGPGGIALRLRLQRGVAPGLVAAFTQRGVDAYEQRLPAIRWPWEEEPAEAVPSLDEQLSELLERRLNASP